MTTSLAQLQQQFQDYIFTGSPQILNEIVSNPSASAETRMNVYRNAYYLRLIEILALDFVLIKALLGADEFANLARKYIDAYPSQEFSIRIFGRHFAEFISKQTGLDNVVAELALLEWKLARLLDGGDADLVKLEDIAQVAAADWAMMQFTCHPTVEIITFETNAPDVWQAYQEEEILPAFKSLSEPQDYLIWRKELIPYLMPINKLQAFLLQGVQQQKTFGELCEELCEFLPEEEVVQFVAGTLRNWVEQGIFAELHLALE